jgi:hypothetical protein
MAQAQVRAKGSVKECLRELFDAERRNAEKIQLHALGLTEDDELPPYPHQHFPMALYRKDEGGELEEIHVADEKAETEARKAGFTTLAEALHPPAPETPEKKPAPETKPEAQTDPAKKS